MGRQLNFYIDDTTKKSIFDSIFEKGFTVYSQYQDTMEIVIVNQNFSLERSLTNKFFLHKKEFGNLKMKEEYFEGRTNLRIDSYDAPVIELSFGNIVHEKMNIYRSRIYVVLQYFDENGNTIEKNSTILKEYNALVRLIKKNVSFRDIPKGENGEYVSKAYVSDSVKILADNGYRVW